MRNIILLIITLSFLSIDSVWAKDNEHEIFKDSCYVKSKDEWYKLRADFNLPNSPTLWNAISQQLFHKETPSADSAYTKYIHSFAEMKDMKKFIQTKEMPNWKPGRQNGFSFIVKCTMIIDITPTFK